MVPLALRKALVKRFQEDFESYRYQKPKEAADEQKRDVPLNFFEQRLPLKKGKTDTRFPFMLVELTEGSQQSQQFEADYKARVNFLVGIYDDSDENSGDDDVIRILNNIMMNLEENPIVGDQFVLDPLEEISWTVSDEETSPYYFGGLSATFNIPKMVRNDLEREGLI